MSILSNATGLALKVKEASDSVNLFLDDHYITKRLPRIIRLLSALILLFVFIQQYWNILGYFCIKPLPLLSANVGKFISNIIYSYGIYWGIYHFIGFNILCRLIVCVDYIKNSTLIRYLLTIDDIIELGVSIVFLVYSIDELLYFANYGIVALKIRFMYYIAVAYLACLFIGWVYRKNCHNPYSYRTDFYDSENKRIFSGDYVIYYNKLYKIQKNFISNTDKITNEDPYVLAGVSYYNNTCISLEVAVKDKPGKLTVLQREIIC